MVGPALTLTSYLLGSLSSALLFARARGVDLRKVGSGNLGATNAGRALGSAVGRWVLALDALKGAAPAVAARAALGLEDPWTAATGFAAALGHCFPVWHGFRGGKGAATAAGVLLVLTPPAGLTALLTYAALKKLTRRASVGSLGGALVGTAATMALRGFATPISMMALALLVLVVVRHRDNVVRLWRGEEPPS